MHKHLAVVLMTMLALPIEAATVYVSDALTVPLRRGPSTEYKVLHAGLPSGTALEVLGEDSARGFTQVRMANGTAGWLPTQYLVSEPVAKDRLAAAEKQVESLRAELRSVRDHFQEARRARSEAESRNTDLDKQTRQLGLELAELKRVAAHSVAYYEESNKLKGENVRLRNDVSQLTQQTQSLQRNVQLRWLLFGGGLVLLGLIFGVMIKSRPQRRGFG